MKIILSTDWGLPIEVDEDVAQWCEDNQVPITTETGHEILLDELGKPYHEMVSACIDIDGPLATDFFLRFQSLQ